MAIIIGQAQCCICEQEITEHEAWTATWGVPFAPPHPLYPFCDAPLHFSCLSGWSHREEYSQGYFQLFRSGHESGMGHLLGEGKRWFLGCGPCIQGQRPRYAQVVLAHWPIRLKMNDWHRWDRFLANDFQDGLSGPCLADAKAVMEEVRKIAGDQKALNALHDAQG
ncbi:MAG: hypothetical protein H7Z41_11355 [Cytophagales bacterium]|nr:hypothetical protein [Armatimonadota bacterium]